MNRNSKARTLKRFIQALGNFKQRKLTRAEISALKYFVAPFEK